MKKLSIILPAYNIEKHILQTVKSITEQTYKNLEIIVIDDNSSDGTLDVIKEIAANDDRIKIFHNKKNIGPGPSRNLGIEKSTGYYITFMDHDDWQNLDRYEKMIQQIEYDGTDLCFSYAKDFIEDEEKFIDTGYPKFETGIINFKKERSKFFHSFFPPWSKIYKSDLIKKNNIKFAENGVKFDDVLFHSLLIFSINKASIYNEFNYFHRVFNNSITYKFFEDKKFMRNEYLSSMKQALEINPSRKIIKYYLKLVDFKTLAKEDLIYLFKRNPLFFILSIKKLTMIIKKIYY